MFGTQKVNVTLTSRAKSRIDRDLALIKLRSPIFCLSWGTTAGRVNGQWIESPLKWTIGYNERDTAVEYEGWLGIADTFEFHVIQEWVLQAVDNRTLDIDENGQISFAPPIPPELIDPPGNAKQRV